MISVYEIRLWRCLIVRCGWCRFMSYDDVYKLFLCLWVYDDV